MGGRRRARRFGARGRGGCGGAVRDGPNRRRPGHPVRPRHRWHHARRDDDRRDRRTGTADRSPGARHRAAHRTSARSRRARRIGIGAARARRRPGRRRDLRRRSSRLHLDPCGHARHPRIPGDLAPGVTHDRQCARAARRATPPRRPTRRRHRQPRLLRGVPDRAPRVRRHQCRRTCTAGRHAAMDADGPTRPGAGQRRRQPARRARPHGAGLVVARSARLGLHVVDPAAPRGDPDETNVGGLVRSGPTR